MELELQLMTGLLAAGKMKTKMKMNMRKIATKISKGHANRNANTKAAGQDLSYMLIEFLEDCGDSDQKA